MRVIVELAPSETLAENAGMAVTDESVGLADSVKVNVAGLTLDTSFPPVELVGRLDTPTADSILDPRSFVLSDNSADSTYLVRGEIDADDYEKVLKSPKVKAIYADPVIEPFAVCPTGPVGTDADVERLLCTSRMRPVGMDGTGVLVAIVDTGINLDHLRSRGKTPVFDAASSWVPRAGLTPGSLAVGHGTMCAYDVLIAAPNCTLADIALLQSNAPGGTVMEGLLSDAVRAFNHLLTIMRNPRRRFQSMVVNNSWGMFRPSWDFPVGHPGNYSDNPNHPFNLLVGNLERAGADILFAAGNCGSDCPDGRCREPGGAVFTNRIYGANSHPAVLSVAGVTIDSVRIGYSTKGPGCLTHNKPDLAGFTHFRGSGVYSADGGTSAACPVVAGVVAAVRSVRPYDATNPVTAPAAIRTLMTTTATDVTPSGYDLETGFGIVGGCRLIDRLFPLRVPVDFCRRFPNLCGRWRWPVPNPFPNPFPWPGPFPGPQPGPFPGPQPGPGPRPGPFSAQTDDGGYGDTDDSQLEGLLMQAYYQGLMASGQYPAMAHSEPQPRKKCNCGCTD